MLKLSKKGQELLPDMQKIWNEIKDVNQKIVNAQEHNLLVALEEMENNWQEKEYLQNFKKFDFQVALAEGQTVKIKEIFKK